MAPARRAACGLDGFAALRRSTAVRISAPATIDTRRTARGAVRDRIDAADQAVMARLSAESSPVLDGFLPGASRSADFRSRCGYVGIAAALAASKDERGRRAARRGLAGMVIANTASNVLAKGLVRRPRPVGEDTAGPPDRRPRRDAGGAAAGACAASSRALSAFARARSTFSGGSRLVWLLMPPRIMMLATFLISPMTTVSCGSAPRRAHLPAPGP